MKSNGHGGVRPGAGRPPKADELELIEKLKPLDDLAFKELQKGLATGDPAFLKLFMAYRFGQPKQTVDLNGDLSVNWFEQKTYDSDKETNEGT